MFWPHRTHSFPEGADVHRFPDAIGEQQYSDRRSGFVLVRFPPHCQQTASTRLQGKPKNNNKQNTKQSKK